MPSTKLTSVNDLRGSITYKRSAASGMPTTPSTKNARSRVATRIPAIGKNDLAPAPKCDPRVPVPGFAAARMSPPWAEITSQSAASTKNVAPPNTTASPDARPRSAATAPSAVLPPVPNMARRLSPKNTSPVENLLNWVMTNSNSPPLPRRAAKNPSAQRCGRARAVRHARRRVVRYKDAGSMF